MHIMFCDCLQDAIVSSLQEYNQHIESLKIEMEEATQSAEEIRREIQSFRNKCVVFYVFFFYAFYMGTLASDNGC